MSQTEIVDCRPCQGLKILLHPSEDAFNGKSLLILSTYTHYSHYPQREKRSKKEKVTTTKSQLSYGNIYQ